MDRSGKTALERWFDYGQLDERAGNLVPGSGSKEAVRPTRKPKLVLDPTTGQISPKVKPATEQDTYVKPINIQSADETFD